MTSVLKKLTLSLLCSVLLALGLAGCSSNEPQGFMVGDTEGLGHGIPAPEPSTAPAPAASDPAKKPQEAGESTPPAGEAKNSLGYTPDAEGGQSGQPASK